MVHSAIVRIVDFCARRRRAIIIAGTLLMLGAAAFDATRFSINTDIEGLKSADGFARIQPLIATLALDPSLRGAMKTLSFCRYSIFRHFSPGIRRKKGFAKPRTIKRL
jgi:hypothetical protein